jgi:glycosyltransferase involved in cell wall biosynthesis
VKIGIDARPLSKQRTGVGNYVEGLLTRLSDLAPEQSYVLYSNRDIESTLPDKSFSAQIDRRFSRLPGGLWLRTRAASLARPDNLDVFWSTYPLLPSHLPKRVLKIVTVYDLVWLKYPETTSTYNLLVQKLWSRRSIAQADRIIVISKSTQEDLVEALGVPTERTRLIYPGVGEEFFPGDKAEAANYISAKYGIPPRYMATVCSVEPRKNLRVLVEAVRLLKLRGQLQCPLLVAGASGWKNSELFAQIKRAGITESEIRFLGYLPASDLRNFYAGAQLFLFPTLYEGFGLPPVEAMACGTAVIASDARCMPEVLGDSAILRPPDRADEFADSIFGTLSNSDLLAKLEKAGIERASRYRWNDSAAQLASVFAEANQREIPSHVSANRKDPS